MRSQPDGRRGPPWARYINVILGLWLCGSGLLWARAEAVRLNTWGVGTLVVVFSLWGVFVPSLRRLNSALACWLVVYTLAAPPTRVDMLWSNIAAGVAIFVFSLVSSRPLGPEQSSQGLDGRRFDRPGVDDGGKSP